MAVLSLKAAFSGLRANGLLSALADRHEMLTLSRSLPGVAPGDHSGEGHRHGPCCLGEYPGSRTQETQSLSASLLAHLSNEDEDDDDATSRGAIDNHMPVVLSRHSKPSNPLVVATSHHDPRRKAREVPLPPLHLFSAASPGCNTHESVDGGFWCRTAQVHIPCLAVTNCVTSQKLT